jgi:hypothetical protein
MNTLHLNDDETKNKDSMVDPWAEHAWPDETPFAEPVADEAAPYDEVETVYIPREVFVPEPLEPEPMAETIRKGGLAWSAGIAFFGSVVFMLFLGWIADLLLGSSPWGLVGGIIFGSLIGFVQFFRITSRIFLPKPDIKTRPLFSEPKNAAEIKVNDDPAQF